MAAEKEKGEVRVGFSQFPHLWEGTAVGVICLDFSKALDIVFHEILVEKLLRSWAV